MFANERYILRVAIRNVTIPTTTSPAIRVALRKIDKFRLPVDACAECTVNVERLTAVGADAFTVNECWVTESDVFTTRVKFDTVPFHVPLGALVGIKHDP